MGTFNRSLNFETWIWRLSNDLNTKLRENVATKGHIEEAVLGKSWFPPNTQGSNHKMYIVTINHLHERSMIAFEGCKTLRQWALDIEITHHHIRSDVKGELCSTKVCLPEQENQCESSTKWGITKFELSTWFCPPGADLMTVAVPSSLG
jgi:hypothetical protein